MGRWGHHFFLGGVGMGGVVRCQGVIKEKSPDFRSPEVGIPGFGFGWASKGSQNNTLQTLLHTIRVQ